MSYLFPFLRLTMQGEVANGQDIWSAGLHVGGVANGDAENIFTLMKNPGAMTALANIVADFIDEPAVKVPSGVTLESIKLAHLGTDGKYVEAALEEERFAQGNLAASYIPQAAIVNTLDSGKFKDPGKYNRFYLPVALGGTQDNWCLTPTEQAAYAAATANFIGELNDFFEPMNNETPQSVSVISNSGTGYAFTADFVRIGRVVDTQRRRRNQIAEAYVTEPIVAI